MDNGKKSVPKILTTDDIRKSARDWTLAGDVGLLAHLEQFSKNIINKTQETQKNFNELVDHYEGLYTKVGNITNQFLALQNCQFVENRVYDEETPTEEKAEVKIQNKAEQEKLLLMQYKEAVEIGVKLLDTHFQEVQLPPSSDSDEDEEISTGKSVIWKPNNPYVLKKFPLLIGSAEWWADDHVGLRANEDILEADKIISESESDMESLKSVEKTMKSSSSTSLENVKSKPTLLESSSEDLFGFDKNENVKNNATDGLSRNSNSLLEESARLLEKKTETEPKTWRDSFYENEPREQADEKANKIEADDSKPNKVDNAFTRELMAKLVSVTNKNRNTGKEKAEEKSQENSPPTIAKTEENLFDETDDSCDLFSVKINNTQEKSPVHKRLFFDAENDDELFKGENDLFSGSTLFENDNLKKPENQLFENNYTGVPKETKKSEQEEIVKPKKNLVNDLFDDVDDEDTLFTSKPISFKSSDKSRTVGNGSFKKEKPTASLGLDWDNDEGLFNSIDTKIDNGIFNSSDLFDVSVKKTPEFKGVTKSKNQDLKPDELFETHSEIIQKTKEPIEEKREENPVSDSNITKIATAIDSFDDSYNFSTFKGSSNLKIGILDSEDEGDLFSKTVREEKKPIAKGVNLPPDDDGNTALFAGKPKPPDSVSVSSSRSSLFDDLSSSKSRLASVFEKDKSSKPEDDFFNVVDDPFFAGDTKPGKDLFSTKNRDKEKLSLFDDCHDDEDDDDDLFGVAKNDDAKDKSLLEKPSGDFGGEKIDEDIFKKNKHSVRGIKSFIGNLGDDDLFGTLETPTKVRESKSDIIIQPEEKLFPDDLDDSDLFSDKPTPGKPKPPSSLSLKARETAPKGKAIHKLNIPDNLKVKFESVAKHISSGMKPPGEKKNTEPREEEVLDVSLQPSVLLKCPSKDRVKIPGRRRPQSRRARQEAIRNSGTWDQPTSPDGNSNLTVPSKEFQSSPVASNPLSPSTDEEDFFKVPELDTNFEKEDQSIFKSDLFESSKSSKIDDNLLFDGAPVLSPLSPKKLGEPEGKHENLAKSPETDSLFGFSLSKTVKIFDDELEENNDEILFKPSKPATGGSALFSFPGVKEGKFKRPLFEPDLDDEEDDLFKGKALVTPSNLPVVDKPVKKSDGAKDKGNSNFVDPLGLVSKKE